MLSARRCAGWRIIGLLLCLVIGDGGFGFGLMTAHAATTLVVTEAREGSSGSLDFLASTANAGDTIIFDPTVFPPTATTPVEITPLLGAPPVTISKNLTIIGPGARAVAVKGICTSSGCPVGPPFTAGPVLVISMGATVTLSGITLENGNSGIVNRGTLTLANSVVMGNIASNDGGGIANYGTLTVTNSIISGNTTQANARGGGIANHGALTLMNSTVTGNTAADGGISNDSMSNAALLNDTVSGNTATSGVGGGIATASGGTTTATNSLIVNNTPAALSGSLASPSGYNLIAPFSFASPLTDNGGPTNTLAIAPTSPAAGAGDPAICTSEHVTGADGTSITVDQRGATRVANNTCSIGAFEPGLVRTLTTLSMSPLTASAGASVTLTAHVSGVLGGPPRDGATITFLNGTTPLGTGTLMSGAATLSTTAPATTANLTARYDSNAVYAGSSSSGLTTLNLPPISITPYRLFDLTVGQEYSNRLDATGGAGGPYTFAPAPGDTLPPGESLVGNVFQGIPTTAGIYTFTIVATDKEGNTGSQQYTQIIDSPLIITPTMLPSAIINNPYHLQFTAIGGNGAPYVFSSIDVPPNPPLPPGLTLSSDGLLSGTPTQGGTFAFLINVHTQGDTSGLATGMQVALTVRVPDAAPVMAIHPAMPVMTGVQAQPGAHTTGTSNTGSSTPSTAPQPARH